MGLRTAIARSVQVVRRPRAEAWEDAAKRQLGPEPASPRAPGPGIRWVPVQSSWIEALRWVPTDRATPTAYLATGYIDMRTKRRGGSAARAYRYGPGISQRQFNTWVVAASRGRYWWRYFTRRWSPAQPLY